MWPKLALILWLASGAASAEPTQRREFVLNYAPSKALQLGSSLEVDLGVEMLDRLFPIPERISYCCQLARMPKEVLNRFKFEPIESTASLRLDALDAGDLYTQANVNFLRSVENTTARFLEAEPGASCEFQCPDRSDHFEITAEVQRDGSVIFDCSWNNGSQEISSELELQHGQTLLLRESVPHDQEWVRLLAVRFR